MYLSDELTNFLENYQDYGDDFDIGNDLREKLVKYLKENVFPEYEEEAKAQEADNYECKVDFDVVVPENIKNPLRNKIDIVITAPGEYDPQNKELFAIAVKFPKVQSPKDENYEKEMRELIKDIFFMEQLKKNGFKEAYVITVVDDRNFYSYIEQDTDTQQPVDIDETEISKCFRNKRRIDSDIREILNVEEASESTYDIEWFKMDSCRSAYVLRCNPQAIAASLIQEKWDLDKKFIEESDADKIFLRLGRNFKEYVRSKKSKELYGGEVIQYSDYRDYAQRIEKKIKAILPRDVYMRSGYFLKTSTIVESKEEDSQEEPEEQEELDMEDTLKECQNIFWNCSETSLQLFDLLMDNLIFNGYRDNDGTEKVVNINKRSRRVEWNLVEVDVKYEICNLLLKLNKEEPETWRLDPNDVTNIANEMKLNFQSKDFEGLVQFVPRR
jgi:hypothetical protein